MAGLIYGAIVVMWLAFLVPMWLRRHDDATEVKSVDRFSTAMKVLARRTTAPDVGDPAAGAEVDTRTSGATAVGAMNADAADDSATDSPHPDAAGRLATARVATAAGFASVGQRLGGLVARRAPADEEPEPARPATTSSHRSTVAVRRQRVLAVLGGLVLLLAVLAGLSLVPWLAVAPAVALLVAYLVLLRAMARRAPTAVRARVATVEHLSAAATVPSATGGTRTEYGVVHTVKVNPPPARRDHAPLAPSEDAGVTGVLPAAHLDTTPALDTGYALDGFVGPRVGWDPVPVPAPTYVNAPRAPRAVRSIDLSSEGAWTSGRLVADAKAAAAAAVARSGSRDDTRSARRAVGD